MKIINLSEVRDKIREMVQKANFELQDDTLAVIKEMEAKEESPAGKSVFQQILKNADIARDEKLGLCQDTGLAIFFVELGEDVELNKDDGLGSLKEAITVGTRAGYEEGYLRKSVVEDPIRRKNTGDNTPAYIHWELEPGDAFKVTFVAKGGGAENMSQVRMFAPAAGQEGIENFVVEVVDTAGSNPCPPIVVGVGVGGNFEYSALLAKKALLRRPLGSHNTDPHGKNPSGTDQQTGHRSPRYGRQVHSSGRARGIIPLPYRFHARCCKYPVPFAPGSFV